jgi:hypothetical protein
MLVSSKIFRSRWSALFWSAGILWTAYDVASSAPHHHAAGPDNGQAPDGNSVATDATGEAITAADLQALANAMPAN